MKQILILLLFSTCFAACSKSNKSTFGAFNPKNLPEQVFQLPLHKDTLLKTQGGIMYKVDIVYYTFSMTNYEWLNCDTRLFEGQPEVGAFEVTAAEGLEMNLIFRNRNAVWNFWDYENHNPIWKFWDYKKQYRLMGKEADETIQLPVGEPVTIFAFKKMKNGQIKFGTLDTQVQKQNKIKIELKDISEAEFEKILNLYK